ncbi:hypothetical protein EVAR_74265_1 [Eumeta japonica]|uniref:Dual serine/threonine and tyrosine protein kinase n=1 Tax=Eumeta variegata TaxID=151549 RepID=A0A4C1SFK5_EUMVA|nr:hypothetical protein EVAR_74265_1 [Eumeta japonica]
MAGGSAGGTRRSEVRMRMLRNLVRDTQRALSEVSPVIHIESEVSYLVQDVGLNASQPTALVILGRTAKARARLLHALLGHQLLPDPPPIKCRWLRVQYGNTRQAHLTLGNSEFELIEELECSKNPTWVTIPPKDLIRTDMTDLATVFDLELNNQFLKENTKIIIPPDIGEEIEENATIENLREEYCELFSKRTVILKHFNPIYLYAVDSMGKNIFSENICDSRMLRTKSEEDFWATCSMYYMTRSLSEPLQKIEEADETTENFPEQVVEEKAPEVVKERYVFTAENCLDLQLINEINPTSQVFFVLFSDSVDLECSSNYLSRIGDNVNFTEAMESTAGVSYSSVELSESHQNLGSDEFITSPKTESTQVKSEKRYSSYEEQCSFMNELMDQWVVVATHPPKSKIIDNWMILDDKEVYITKETKPLAPILSDMTENVAEASKGSSRITKQEKKELRNGNLRLVKNRNVLVQKISKFATAALRSYVLEYCTKLSEVHVRLLQKFILVSFDLAREMQVVPKKIQYAAKQEQQLYENIYEKFTEGDKKRELVAIMQEVLHDMKTDVNAMDWTVDDLPCHQDNRFSVSNSVFYETSQRSINPEESSVNLGLSQTLLSSVNDIEQGISFESYNFDDYEIINSPRELSVQPEANEESDEEHRPPNIPVAEDVFSVNSSVVRFGTGLIDQSAAVDCPGSQVSVKQASLDVQKTVLGKLSRKISLKLVNFVDCLRDSYFGTLQRCLESLEESCRAELGGRPASEAVRRLLSAARQVDLQPCASFSLLRSLLDTLRRLFHRLRLVSGSVEAHACCPLSPLWRRRVALHTVHSLSAPRLARIISQQILERVSAAHERYQSALATLEGALAERLHHTEDAKLAIRKKYAPGFARLCLESTSMCDLLMYGLPDIGREIGRGQYGVVYACRAPWAGRAPVAVKSVLPADDRHFNDLAMEFFYTRSIPEHPRIVRLFGSVVERHPSSGGPTVLLVTARLVRDLHCAVRAGLSFSKRMRIALDIVEGLHSTTSQENIETLKPDISEDNDSTQNINILPEKETDSIDYQIVSVFLSIRVAQNSFKCFQPGIFDFKDEPCSSRPVTDKIDAILEKVKQGRHISSYDIGIRYLHSLGLVHRDIKMKNVLLDAEDRASLTDLGFLSPGALMSGSVVGTPVHMAPELMTGDYDSSVDVYAFGILFWYVCAGNIKLPSAFEMFQNKEQLWSRVRRGLRPERLPHFTEACWRLMESCWASEPSQRALLGDVQPILEKILEEAVQNDTSGGHSAEHDHSYGYDSVNLAVDDV